ncbi:hypothetical protein [Rhizobium hainanense]|uniref:Lipoprotein n=1 Tax=Rhizobium hainanense TaxID=52131 RepID=A0A1C3VHS2_9HYPH|nr:hypothetical protein [Rhizobium hainanense]SCB27316.1 hypothetical protein GA0061100_106139 [Rhizobium hainanense]
MRKAFSILTLISPVLASCASFTPAQVAKPSDISLDTALNDVATSLHKLQHKYAGKEKIGMMVDEVQVQFAIAVTAADSGKVQLNVADIPVGAAGGTFGASAEHDQSSSANRGNTITVTFKNVASADLSKGSFSLLKPAGKGGKATGDNSPKWTPEQLTALQKALEKLKVFDVQPGGS